MVGLNGFNLSFLLLSPMDEQYWHLDMGVLIFNRFRGMMQEEKGESSEPYAMRATFKIKNEACWIYKMLPIWLISYITPIV